MSKSLDGLHPERVCIIKPSSLGDIVHALPALTALRELWPDAKISWVVNRSLRGLLDGHPHLDEVIPFDRGFGPGSVATTARFLRNLRRARFDVVIDMQGLFRSAVMTAATGSPIRLGMDDAREGAT